MSGLFDMPPDWKKHWRGMPSFDIDDLTSYQSLVIHFRNPEDRESFSKLLGRGLTDKTPSVWWPREEIDKITNKRFRSEKTLNPRYPVYVISKGRWKSRFTAKALEKMNVPYRIVVEPQELGEYEAVIDPKKILVLPFSNLGQGSIPARNWVWEHSISEGAARHWIMDDNIQRFYRFYKNTTPPVVCGNIFRVMEDFADRYENVALAGPQYFMFICRKSLYPAYVANTRIYSCILIRNDLYPEGERWRGRYNEDTDLSLRALKDGWCTVQFNAFLQHKTPTMIMKGGNTEELYKGDGRFDMAESLRKQHPDVVEVVRKWGRWQHHVDYRRFKRNKLKLKGDVGNLAETCEYGMYLEKDDESADEDAFFEERTVLIGQAPGRNGDLDAPLEGKIGRRLSKLAGITTDEYLEATERLNLLDDWPGKKGKGDEWPVKKAEKSADELRPNLSGRRILFVGRNVARAFGFDDVPRLEWRKTDEFEFAWIPHPSGIVLWWNDRENRERAGRFLRECFNRGDER